MNYIQTDDLQLLIDWQSILALPRYAGGHDAQMTGLLSGVKVVGHWNEGDYQGYVATAVELPDGRCAIYNDSYGSCSGCDAWEDATDEQVRSMCMQLAAGAYVFPDAEAAVAYLQSIASGEIEPGDYGWRYAAAGLLGAIENGITG